MFVPFDSLPDSSRIWIYQSNRKFSTSELSLLTKTLEEFCEQWAAHGSPIKSSVKVFYDQFIVLAADESHQAASGCSIDSTLRLFQLMETQFGCSLLDRTLLAFMDNETVQTYPQKALKELFATGVLRKSTLAFNNLVATKGELTTHWLVPIENSWIRRFLPKDTVAT